MKNFAYILLLSASILNAAEECAHSSLYSGKLASLHPGGKLEDYSFVGYKAGAPIPSAQGFVDVRNFGAVGDGFKEDSGAFSRAIVAAEEQGKNLFIPAGKYKLRKKFSFRKSNMVIKGEGPDKTKLLFKHSLADLNGNDQDIESNEYLKGGMIEFLSEDPLDSTNLLGEVTSTASRGEKKLIFNSVDKLRPGKWIRLVWSDRGEYAREGSFLHSLLDDKLRLVDMPLVEDRFRKSNIVSFMSPIKEISGKTVTLVRPLPFRIQPDWIVKAYNSQQSVQDIGVEDLSIHFDWSPTAKHSRERGLNGIYIEKVKNCWVKNVHIVNADYGVNLKDSHFCSIKGVKLSTTKSREGVYKYDGHHGITVSGGSENLVEDFDVSARFRHDITSSTFSVHTVFSKGKGVDLNMDLHRMFPYATLFTEIDLGAGTTPFRSGGKLIRGPHSGAFTTFWNIWADNSFTRHYDPQDFGPSLNYVGVRRLRWMTTKPEHWFHEDFGHQEMCVPNLYRSMALDASWKGVYSDP